MFIVSAQSPAAPDDRPGVSRFFPFLLLFLASFSLSGTTFPNSHNIDASWQASIEYAAAHRWQFGTDIIFTYGPLGFLTSKFGQGYFLLSRVIAACVTAAMTAWLTLSVAPALDRKTRIPFLLWAIFFAASVDMEQNLFFIMACASLRLAGTRKYGIALLLLPAFLAYLSLIKFTFFLGAVIAVILSSACLLLRGFRLHAVTVSTVFSAVFASLWKSMGQNLGNLGPWIRSSLEITAGYSTAMYSPPDPLVFSLTLCAVALFIFMLIYAATGRIRTLSELIPLLLVFLFAFISWKQGIVRADELHIARFIVSFPLIAALVVALVHRNKPVGNSCPLAISLGVIAILCISVAQIQTREKNFLVQSMHNFIGSVRQNSLQLGRIATGRYEACFKDPGKAEEELPPIKARVGQGSIDVISSVSWVAMGNGLNYTPRPVVQGYAAFTPYLQNMNLSFMKSTRRPEWLVLMMDTLDDRLPVMEDALLFPWVLKNYSLQWNDDIYLLLRSKSPLSAPPKTELLVQKTMAFGEPLDLGKDYGFPCVLKVEIPKTPLGKLAAILYSCPPLSMTLEFGDEKLTRRFIPSMAQEGFILNPLLLNVEDVTDYYRGKTRVLERLTFNIPGHLKPLYSDKIRISISRVSL